MLKRTGEHPFATVGTPLGKRVSYVTIGAVALVMDLAMWTGDSPAALQAALTILPESMGVTARQGAKARSREQGVGTGGEFCDVQEAGLAVAEPASTRR